MRQSIALFLVLAGTWLAWSGLFTTLLLSFAVLSCLLVVLIIRRMQRATESYETYPFGPRILLYIPWVLEQIFWSNLKVASKILTPSLPIKPQLQRVEMNAETDLGKVAHANTITITPGTVSLDVRDDQILVHALTRRSARAVARGDIDRRVRWMEGSRSAAEA